MPAVHSCPGCDKKIKVPDGAEGKRLKCPGCQTPLLVTEDGLELAQKQAVQSAAKPVRKAPPPTDDDEEEETPKAKKRKQAEDEDERDGNDRTPVSFLKKPIVGFPMWIWLAGGGGLVVVVLVLFLFVLGGGGTKFKEIKKDMTEKQVVDLIGPPMDGDTKTAGMWYNPKATKADVMSGKFNMKESLTVFFKDGKVQNVIYVNLEEALKGFKP